MIFEIHAVKNVANGKQRLAKFLYDNMTSKLTDMEGNEYFYDVARDRFPDGSWGRTPAPVTSKETPLNKSNKIKDLKIQMGLSCNYSCEYCSQRFVPHADTSSPIEVKKFLKNLDLWVDGAPEKIQFWGGEPLVYIKILKPLAEGLREKWPDVKFGMVTNGSLLNVETNKWLDEMGFTIGMSHDGPGQTVRGPDPFADPDKKAAILDLFHRLGPRRMSFNAMVHRENMNRAEIQNWLQKELGTDEFTIGEGGFIDSYDEGGKANALNGSAEQLGFRRLALEQIRAGTIEKFHVFHDRIQEWVNSISSGRKAEILGQKCTMDRLDTIAVDLKGNVITCQNVSAVSIAPNKKNHRIGHVSNLEKVKLDTSTHWSKRPHCRDCPMLQACKGACMFLEGDLWYKSCDNSYSDHLPFFAAAFEVLTGYLPYRIDAAHLPEERQNLWGDHDAEAIVPPTRSANRDLNKELEVA
jgi:uncharacterized protein